MSVPTITAAPTSFGSCTWTFRAPDLVPWLAQCYIEGGFRRRVVLDPDSGIVSLMSTALPHGVLAGRVSDVMGRFLYDRGLANVPLEHRAGGNPTIRPTPALRRTLLITWGIRRASLTPPALTGVTRTSTTTARITTAVGD